MANDPICFRGDFIDVAQSHEWTLYARDEVKKVPHDQKANRGAVIVFVPLPLHGGKEVSDNGPYGDKEPYREDDGDRLQPLGDWTVNHMVRAYPSIEEGNAPKANHGKAVAIDGRMHEFGEKIVNGGEAHWGEDEPHEVMDVKPTDVHSRDSIWDEVESPKACEDGEGGPQQGAHDIPKGDIHLFVPAMCNGHVEISDHEDECRCEEHFNGYPSEPIWQFGVFPPEIGA